MQDNSFFEYVKCNFCGRDDTILVYAGTSRENINIEEFRASGDKILEEPLVKCKNCGLIYVNPRVSSNFALFGYKNVKDEIFVLQSKAREKTFRRNLKIINKYWRKPPGKLLDIGTANGTFLKVAKEAGWQVYGCEPNIWMCQWAKANYGIEINCGTIFDIKFDDDFFDIITLWDVLEHTPNPLEVLNECFRILKKDGLLVVNYPDMGSFIAKLMGKKWVFLLSVHYYYFTSSTLKKFLEHSGFKLIDLKMHIQTLELDYILFRSQPYLKGLAKFLRSLVNLLNIGKIGFPYWMGQTLAIAKKCIQIQKKES